MSTAWLLYTIGFLAVLTDALEGVGRLSHAIPPRLEPLAGIIIVLCALLWPIFASVLVLGRLLRALRNG